MRAEKKRKASLNTKTTKGAKKAKKGPTPKVYTRSSFLSHTTHRSYILFSRARVQKEANRFPSAEEGEDKDDDETSSDSDEDDDEEEDDSSDNNKLTGARSQSSALPVDVEAGRLACLTLVCC
jgi:hypothetical protein